jgi:zinc D-Ala-D-Ala carboxypeptidase
VKLSEHFSLWELTKSQVADRKRIKNEPDKESIQNLKVICTSILEPVRRHYGKPIAPSSGYRCLALNRELGSSDRSQHTTGQAVDFEVLGVANMDLARWIMDNLMYDQLILEFYKEGQPNSGWVHCSYVGQGNRKQAKRFDGRSWEALS